MKAKHVLAGAVAALALTLTNVGIAAANEKQPDTSPSNSEFVGHSVHKMVDFSSDIETEEIHSIGCFGGVSVSHPLDLFNDNLVYASAIHR